MSTIKTVIIFITGALLIVWGCAGMLSRAKLPQIEGAQTSGTKTCIEQKCHPKRLEDIADSSHKKLFEQDSIDKPACELCHGKGSLHLAATRDPALILIYKNMAPKQISEVCLTCHASGSMDEWYKSAHYQKDISCNECHLSHGSSDKLLLKAPDPEICYKCHPEVQPEFKLVSTHQFKDKEFRCSLCHLSHEKQDTLGEQDIRLRACLDCHKEYAVEFQYPHKPVQEDCLKCHLAHGSEYPKLCNTDIKTQCESCHSVVHRTRFISRSFADAEKKLKAGQCVTCHKKVHGSKFPELLSRKMQRMGPPSGFTPPSMGGGAGAGGRSIEMQPPQ